MMININDIHRYYTISLQKTILLCLRLSLLALLVLSLTQEYLLIGLLTKDDHRLDLSLKDDIVIDDRFIEVDHHILPDNYLPFPTVLILDGLLER